MFFTGKAVQARRLYGQGTSTAKIQVGSVPSLMVLPDQCIVQVPFGTCTTEKGMLVFASVWLFSVFFERRTCTC